MVEGTGSVRISRRELREPHDKEQKSKRAKEQRVEFVKLSKGDPGVPSTNSPDGLYIYISISPITIFPLFHSPTPGTAGRAGRDADADARIARMHTAWTLNGNGHAAYY